MSDRGKREPCMERMRVRAELNQFEEYVKTTSSGVIVSTYRKRNI